MSNSSTEKKECGHTIWMDGMKRVCRKPKGHTGNHNDYPWLEGLDTEAIYG
jgi:hypothetical protein